MKTRRNAILWSVFQELFVYLQQISPCYLSLWLCSHQGDVIVVAKAIFPLTLLLEQVDKNGHGCKQACQQMKYKEIKTKKSNNWKDHLAGTSSSSAGLDLYRVVSSFKMLFSLSVQVNEAQYDARKMFSHLQMPGGMNSAVPLHMTS